jgi:hypothetical protein
VLDHAFEVFVLADEFESSAGADTFYGVEIIAAEENTEVNKLDSH